MKNDWFYLEKIVADLKFIIDHMQGMTQAENISDGTDILTESTSFFDTHTEPFAFDEEKTAADVPETDETPVFATDENFDAETSFFDTSDMTAAPQPVSFTENETSETEPVSLTDDITDVDSTQNEIKLWDFADTFDDEPKKPKNAWVFDEEQEQSESFAEAEALSGLKQDDSDEPETTFSADAKGQDWEWDYEEVPVEEAASDGEGKDWVWDYEPAEVPADARFDTENLAPIGRQAPIYSGDLFFQQEVFKTENTPVPLPEGNLNLLIKDSAAEEEPDPYQNSDTKD